MAGSRKTMVYTADDFSEYWVDIDESNGELGGFKDYTSTTIDVPSLPKGCEMRFVNAIDPTTGAKRRIYIGTPDDPLFLGAVQSLLLTLLNALGLAPALTAFQILSRVGEKWLLARANDTGLTDGDAT